MFASLSKAIKLPKHSNAAWVFFGRRNRVFCECRLQQCRIFKGQHNVASPNPAVHDRNPGSRILRGRPEHTVTCRATSFYFSSTPETRKSRMPSSTAEPGMCS